MPVATGVGRPLGTRFRLLDAIAKHHSETDLTGCAT